MPNYFGVTIFKKTDGMKLTRENYIKINNKSSLVKGMVYSESIMNQYIESALYNYDLNLAHTRSLSKKDFDEELIKFINGTKSFIEITDLSALNRISGYYVMVLDEYTQAYIGRSNDIKKRVQSHWSKQKELDRLVFGSKERSILSIDSFRAYDTTRMFVYKTSNIEGQEDEFINSFDKKYLLNRTVGGTLPGLSEATLNAKTRFMSIDNNDL